MKVTETQLSGLLVIQPTVYQDSRGYFFEAYNKETFSKIGISANFVQDNQSLSGKHVLRGLHFQNPPYAQSKLVRVLKGAALDVAVDIRKNSDTYGQHYAATLSEKNFTMMWIPEGFAHGFLTLEEDTIFAYKCTRAYNRESEDGLLWNDPDLGIDWGTANPAVSEKDRNAQRFSGFNSMFK